jgi:RNA polymerase sigma factor (sigma-70 family)
VALVKAARRFDPSLGVPFPAFATPYVRGAIADAVRARVRRNNLGDGVYADVVGFPALVRRDAPDQAYEPPDPGPGPEETVESLERLRVLATLPERERIALIRTIVDGEAAEVVAEDLGVTTSRVYVLVRNGSARVRRRAA